MKEDNRVIIEQMEDELFHLYDESGSLIEGDFDTWDEANQWAIDNDKEIVELFNL